MDRIHQIMPLLAVLALSVGGALRADAQTPTLSFASGIGGASRDIAKAIIADAGGNSYVTGSFAGTVDFDPGAGTTTLTAPAGGDAAFVASYDAAGALRWAFALGSTGSPNVGTAIALDAAGNLVIAGKVAATTDFDPGPATATRAGGGMFVAKYTTTGVYLSAFVIAVGVTGSGDPEGIVLALAIDGAGNSLVTGAFFGTVDFDPGVGKASITATKSRTDVFVAKYTSAGAYVWAFALKSTATKHTHDIAVDAAGNVYVTGWLQGTVDFDPSRATASLTSGTGEAMVAKYTSAGAYQWAFLIPSSSSCGYALATDGSGDIVVAGYFTGTADFDPGAGTAQLTGYTNNGNPAATSFLARYSGSGAYQSAFTMAPGFARAVDVDANDDIHVAGVRHIGNNDFDPGPGTTSFAGRGGFVATYTASGTLVSVVDIASTGTTGNLQCRALDAIGADLYVTGIFNGSADFDPSAVVNSYTSAGSHDVFLARYTATTLPKRSTTRGAVVETTLAPNPFTDAIHCRVVSAASRIDVSDITGRIVETLRDVAPGDQVVIGTSLAPGVYFVRIECADGVRHERVVKTP